MTFDVFLNKKKITTIFFFVVVVSNLSYGLVYFFVFYYHVTLITPRLRSLILVIERLSTLKFVLFPQIRVAVSNRVRAIANIHLRTELIS